MLYRNALSGSAITDIKRLPYLELYTGNSSYLKWMVINGPVETRMCGGGWMPHNP